MTTKYHDEYGNEFVGPYGVGTLLGDFIVSYPDEIAARMAALKSCTEHDYYATVYGPQEGTRRARKITVYHWVWGGDAPHEV